MFLPQCSDLRDPKRSRCYVRGLLAVIERSGDPAHELPRIDGRVHTNGGFLESNCHMLMHQVGRMWATRHGVTLENVFRYVPKSNDPGCSAGFGMGLVIHLGTQIVLKPRSVLPSCTRLPTRFREYTCIHGSGHALMRGYHGQLTGAVRACDTLGKRFAPDCAQGAFHDYWISLSGGDGTKQQDGADTDPRSVCGSHSYPRPCWYRFFWERMPDASVETSKDFLDLCRGLEGLQRAGCIGGASLLVAGRRGPVEHAQLCATLSGSDTLDCLRGINVPAVAGSQWEQLGLIRTCSAAAELDPCPLLRLVRSDAGSRHERAVRTRRMQEADEARGPGVVCCRRAPHGRCAADVLLRLFRRPAWPTSIARAR